MLLGQHIRLFYLADELRYSGALILQVRWSEREVASAMIVFLQDAPQVLIQAVLPRNGLLESHGTVSVS